MPSKNTLRKFKILFFMCLTLLMVGKANMAWAGTADELYYNVDILTSAELKSVTELQKGTVVVMSPINNEVYVGSKAEEMIINGEVKTISVPGVGSSSIGAAAFAKHIATIRNEYVAGITAGYGDYSIGPEGYQGYFIGRPSNVMGTYYVEPASDKLASLYDRGARPDLLVGHSKGNMDIANALFKMKIQGKSYQFKGVDFTTFGCGVNVPAELGIFKQYLGNLDSLGIMNTVSYKNLSYVIGKYHTTNPYYASTYMPIELYLKK